MYFYFMNTITWPDFEKIDIRAGTIIDVQEFPEARKPAWKLTIDFGELGIKKSSAQITDLYTKETLLNRQVVAVVNFPPKQIGPFISECLVLGVYGDNKEVTLLRPERAVKNGAKIG
ncbi:MAG: tRNA-binding protein [Bacteroidetes bacterium]|nr:MAG: tRNA-binding protein [Bacteroidota bacterium]